MKLSDYLNAINYSKKDILEDEMVEKKYTPFVINRCLSYFPDTLFHANAMNQWCSVSKKMHFDYLRESIRKRKRFSPWLKRENPSELEAIKRIYGLSNSKAKEALKVLSPEQLTSVIEASEKLENPK